MSLLSKAVLSYFGVFILIFVGLFFRLYNFQGYDFGFDQVQILENSQVIKSGRPTLIGPRTGPAAMFTGPLIYYLNTVSLFFINNPYSLVLTNAIISLITVIVLYVLSRRYLNHLSVSAQFVPVVIWAISPFLITLDRTVWNPNFSLLSTSLFFFPLLKRSKLNLIDRLSIFFGAFLSYQAHFTLLLLPCIGLPPILRREHSKVSIILSTVFGYLLTLLPVFIFDLRHEWLNLKGLLALLNNKGEQSTSYLGLFLDTLRISLETGGKLVSDYRGSFTSVALTLLLIMTGILLKQNRNVFANNHSSLLWIIATVLFFSFYPGTKPEYYFLILVPAFMVLCATIISSLKLRGVVVFLLFVVVALQSIVNWHKIQDYTALSMGNIFSVIDYLRNENTKENISVDLKISFGSHYGLEYMLKQAPFPHADKRIVIYYPDPPANEFQEFTGLYLVKSSL